MLQVQSIRDPLTGLFNRRYMDESLERELKRASRNHRPLGLMMIDIDHFKNWNDTYGHDAGDALIREVARLVEHHTRGEDIAPRRRLRCCPAAPRPGGRWPGG
jgi:diguanylate cyclase (GGDEF)-like protein